MRYIKESNYNYYFHGSSIKLDVLKPMPPSSGESKFLGEGIYISNDPRVSKKYSEGGYLYKIQLKEPLDSLKYFQEIDKDRFLKIRDYFQNSDNSDLNYIADNIEYDIMDNDYWWGKKLVSELEREGLNANEILVEVGYNAIECPINRINTFMEFPDTSLNINVIKEDIIVITESIKQ